MQNPRGIRPEKTKREENKSKRLATKVESKRRLFLITCSCWDMCRCAAMKGDKISLSVKVALSSSRPVSLSREREGWAITRGQTSEVHDDGVFPGTQSPQELLLGEICRVFLVKSLWVPKHMSKPQNRPRQSQPRHRTFSNTSVLWQETIPEKPEIVAAPKCRIMVFSYFIEKHHQNLALDIASGRVSQPRQENRAAIDPDA